MAPQEGQILTGPQFSEPVRVETARADGPGSWVLGVVGTKTERFRRVTLTEADLAQILDRARARRRSPSTADWLSYPILDIGSLRSSKRSCTANKARAPNTAPVARAMFRAPEFSESR